MFILRLIFLLAVGLCAWPVVKGIFEIIWGWQLVALWFLTIVAVAYKFAASVHEFLCPS